MDIRLAAQRSGAEGEARVAQALKAEGWSVLSRNWSGGGGELDIVAQRAGSLRFVEVKARAKDDPVGVEAVGRSKQRKLTGAARAWLLEREPDFDDVAFMVVLVEPDGLTWYDDAFDVE